MQPMEAMWRSLSRLIVFKSGAVGAVRGGGLTFGEGTSAAAGVRTPVSGLGGGTSDAASGEAGPDAAEEDAGPTGPEGPAGGTVSTFAPHCVQNLAPDGMDAPQSWQNISG